MDFAVPVIVIALVFATILIIVLAPLIVVLALVRMAMGGSGRQHRSQQQEEARLIQQIHEGLSKMDRRVEALETILLEQRPPGRTPAGADAKRQSPAEYASKVNRSDL